MDELYQSTNTNKTAQYRQCYCFYHVKFYALDSLNSNNSNKSNDNNNNNTTKDPKTVDCFVAPGKSQNFNTSRTYDFEVKVSRRLFPIGSMISSTSIHLSNSVESRDRGFRFFRLMPFAHTYI